MRKIGLKAIIEKIVAGIFPELIKCKCTEARDPNKPNRVNKR